MSIGLLNKLKTVTNLNLSILWIFTQDSLFSSNELLSMKYCLGKHLKKEHRRKEILSISQNDPELNTLTARLLSISQNEKIVALKEFVVKFKVRYFKRYTVSQIKRKLNSLPVWLTIPYKSYKRGFLEMVEHVMISTFKLDSGKSIGHDILLPCASSK